MKNHYTLILVVALIGGFLISKQVKVSQRIIEATAPKNTSVAATEVAELIKNNKKLRDEEASLTEQKKTLEQTGSSAQENDSSLSKELEKLKIVVGGTNVIGEGVEIYFEKSLQEAQVVDLVNALRNIGAEAISINGKRVVASTPFSDETGLAPLTILVVGNKQILNDALLRKGGIIEQIGGGAKVSEKDNLSLPAI